MLDVKAINCDEDIRDEIRAVARFVRRKVKEISKRIIKFENPEGDDKYWAHATLYEACVGLGEEEEAQHWKEKSASLPKQPWMGETTDKQIEKLRKILKK
jgi:hypothetical protein